jgi:TrmH family RNA methyltransferase
VITSHHNPTLQDVRRLLAGKQSPAAGRSVSEARSPAQPARFVAEGEDLVAAAERAGWTPTLRLRADVDVSVEALAKISALASGTRELAVYEQRWLPAAEPLCVALWGVRDPGNVGTILRGARAFGAGSVAIGPGTADPYGAKAVRASMGAVFEVPVVRVAALADLPAPRVGLVAREGDALSEFGSSPARKPVAALLVGAEREGLPAAVVEGCDSVAQIPIENESLNAAMAATVALYEVSR